MTTIAEGQEILRQAIAAGRIRRADPPATPPTAFPVPPFPPEHNPLSRGPLPTISVLQPDTVRQFNSSAIPQTRILPPPRTADPIAGAQAASQAITAIKTLAGAGGLGTVTSVGLVMPGELSVTGSPITSAGQFNVAWVAEPPNTFFRGPSSSVTGLEATAQTQGYGNSTFISVTPKQKQTFALYCEFANNAPLASPSGWTQIGTGGTGLWLNSFSTNAPITVSQSFGNVVGTQANWITALAVFDGAAPTVVQSKSASWGFSNPQTISFTSNVTAGNTLLICIQAINSGALYTLSASDSLGNAYQLLVSQGNGFVTMMTPNPDGLGVQQNLYLVQNCLGGADTISFSITGTEFPFTEGVITIAELSAFPAGAGLPFFGPVFASDIPPINLGSNTKGGVTGLLPLANGGTDANLASTGGTSKFLRQNTVGGAIDVIQPDYSNLAGVSVATKYNGQNLFSNGIPTEVATVDTTALGANVTLTTLYTTPSTGMYRVSTYVIVNRVASSTSTLPDLNLKWTDGDNSATQSATFVSGSPSGNTLTTGFTATQVMWVATGTNIQYQTGDSTAYASSGGTSMTYNVHLKVEMLG